MSEKRPLEQLSSVKSSVFIAFGLLLLLFLGLWDVDELAKHALFGDLHIFDLIMKLA